MAGYILEGWKYSIINQKGFFRYNTHLFAVKNEVLPSLRFASVLNDHPIDFKNRLLWKNQN